MGGNEAKVQAVFWNLQISFFAEGELAAKYTREVEGHTDKGWFIEKNVLSIITTDFNDVLFETVVEFS